MVVDGSIVVVETVRRHPRPAGGGRERRRSSPRRWTSAARIVLDPDLAVILVRSHPPGDRGNMFAPLAATLLIALLIRSAWPHRRPVLDGSGCGRARAGARRHQRLRRGEPRLLAARVGARG
jgi:hypothetical protein